MLEALVSSRIRRTLFEYLLTHPRDRFYLRGLAKELSLSISPLRRELKRLERSGMLRAAQEANILFYTVNTNSPAFLQLQHAGLPAVTAVQAGWQKQTEAPSSVMPLPAEFSAASLTNPGEAGPLPRAIPVGVISTRSSTVSFWRGPLNTPALVGVAVVGMVLMFTMGGVFYLAMTNQRLVSQATRALAPRKAEVNVVVPPSPSSGTMHGSRWRIVPGGFGGFSSGVSDETY